MLGGSRFRDQPSRKATADKKPAVLRGGLGKAGCVNLLQFWVADEVCDRFKPIPPRSLPEPTIAEEFGADGQGVRRTESQQE